MTNYTRWYREGTVTAQKNGTAITGSKTLWATVGLKPGDMFSIDNVTEYEVASISDDTHLTLTTPYLGESVSGSKYRIIRNWTANSSADIAAQASELLGDFARYLDSDMATITGKSAYKIACENGFAGTESEWLASLDAYGVAVRNGYAGTRGQWLESLKGAGEWNNAKTRLTTLETDNTSNKSKISTLETDNTSSKSRISTLENMNADNRLTALETLTGKLDPRVLNSQQVVYNVGWNNMYPRFKNLGTQITAQQYANIQGTKNFDVDAYQDLYPGDYWELTVGGDTMYAVIVQLGGGYIPLGYEDGQYIYTRKHLHMALVTGRYYAMNDTNTTEGGYAASTMHTEVMPALTEELEAAIGAEHVQTIRHWVYNSNVYNSLWKLPHVKADSKLELFRLSEIMNVGFPAAASYKTYRYQPFALFQHVPFMSANSPMSAFNTVLQDVCPFNTSRYDYFNLQYHSDWLSANDARFPVIAHFVLVP